MRHLLSLLDFSKEDIEGIFSLVPGSERGTVLSGRSFGLLFEKRSTRTRVSFELAVAHLGGYSLFLSPQDIHLGVNESIADTGRVLGGYLDGIIARVNSHETLRILAKASGVPVINALSDWFHPCQGLTDAFTMLSSFGSLEGLKVAYVGDGNNVLHSLLLVGSLYGWDFRVASPSGYGPKEAVIREARTRMQKSKGRLTLTHDPNEAVRLADVIYTDTWVSMGQEAEREKRRKIFLSYQVNKRLLSHSRRSSPFPRIMHCLPAHRGYEITDEVLDGERSLVFEQAKNRLPVQRALLSYLFSGGVRS